MIGLGAWGREILNTLMRLPQAEVAGGLRQLCRVLSSAAARWRPAAKPVADYKEILANKDIKAVVIATPTHQHKEVVLEPHSRPANMSIAKRPWPTRSRMPAPSPSPPKPRPTLVFQAGFQLRSDPQRHFLLPFIRSGALGKNVMARAQWHKKQSWRATSPNPEREKEINWRLDKELSLGLGRRNGRRIRSTRPCGI